MKATAKAFHQELATIGRLHDRKQSDYGRSHDPFANVRGSEEMGIPGWIGCLVRANDKVRRLQKAARQTLGGSKVVMANESVEDSFRDLAVYSLIGLLLFREATSVRVRRRRRK